MIDTNDYRIKTLAKEVVDEKLKDIRPEKDYSKDIEAINIKLAYLENDINSIDRSPAQNVNVEAINSNLKNNLIELVNQDLTILEHKFDSKLKDYVNDYIKDIESLNNKFNSLNKSFESREYVINNTYDGEHIVNFYFNQDENLLYLVTDKKELKAYIPVRSTIVNKTIESKSEIESISNSVSKNELVSNSEIVKDVVKTDGIDNEPCKSVKYVARIRIVLARYKGRLGDWEEGGFIYSPHDVRDPEAIVEIHDIMNGVRTLMGFAYPDATIEHNIPIYSECHSGSLRKKQDKPIAYAKNSP